MVAHKISNIFINLRRFGPLISGTAHLDFASPWKSANVVEGKNVCKNKKLSAFFGIKVRLESTILRLESTILRLESTILELPLI